MRGILRPGVGGLSTGTDEIRWWTFAGGRINSTLRYALESMDYEWKVIPDKFVVRMQSSGLSRSEFLAQIQLLHDPAFWDDTRLWDEIAASLPNYRLSKFQPLMPSWVQQEVVARYLLDVAGAQQYVEAFVQAA